MKLNDWAVMAEVMEDCKITISMSTSPEEWCGICELSCEHLKKRLPYGTYINLRRALFVIWPKFSGRMAFPVPSVNKHECEFVAWRTKKLWSRRSAYGRLRWELLDFMIEKSKEFSQTSPPVV